LERLACKRYLIITETTTAYYDSGYLVVESIRFCLVENRPVIMKNLAKDRGNENAKTVLARLKSE